MEIREFIRLADTVIDRLAPKLEPKWATTIRESAGAGSWGFAITELLVLLVDDQIAITPEDREDLRRLLTDLGEPLDDLDRLNIETLKP